VKLPILTPEQQRQMAMEQQKLMQQQQMSNPIAQGGTPIGTGTTEVLVEGANG